MRYRAIAFDWDGTLVDSIDHIVVCLRMAAERMGLDFRDDESLKGIIGLGMQEAIKTIYPSISIAGIEEFRSHYGEVFFSNTREQQRLFPNVEKVLEGLKGQGVMLAVATGKSRRGLESALEATGLGHYFSVERCADESRSKPHPLMLEEIMSQLNVSPEELLMVGDTEFDMEMARLAGVDRVGVSFGAQDVSRLRRHAPLAVVDDMSELLVLCNK